MRKSQIAVLVLLVASTAILAQAKPRKEGGEYYPEGRYPQKVKDAKYPRTYFPNTEKLAKERDAHRCPGHRDADPDSKQQVGGVPGRAGQR